MFVVWSLAITTPSGTVSEICTLYVTARDLHFRKDMKMNENENARILSAFENRLRAGFV